MKKILATLLTAVLVSALVGCGTKTNVTDTVDDTSVSTPATDNNETPANEETPSQAGATYDDSTLGGKLANMFVEGINADKTMDTIANQLAEASDMDCMVVEAVPGYLNGFSEEIDGFSKGIQFSPMIGSIAFVGYIFETDDADALMAKLNAAADPRWNICTEAAETVCIKQGNYVFFTMCPGDEE